MKANTATHPVTIRGSRPLLSGLVAASLCIAAGCGVEDASAPSEPTPGGDVSNAFAAGRTNPARTAALLAAAKDRVRPGTVVQTEPRLGVPTFVWTRDAKVAGASARWLTAGVAHPEVAASRAVIADYAPMYGLDDADVANAVVAHVHDLGSGPVLVKFRTAIGGIEVFGEELSVVMNRKLEPVALSGYLSSAATPPAHSGAMAFKLGSPAGAVAALNHMAGTKLDPSQLVSGGAQDGYGQFGLATTAGITLDDPIRVKQVYFHSTGGLEAAYYVEVAARTGAPAANLMSIDGRTFPTPEAYAYVVSASTGQLLFRKSLIADSRGAPAQSDAVNPGTIPFTYRVWADPVTGIPYDTPAGNDPHPKANPLPDGFQAAFVATNDVTLQNIEFSRNDPWLPAGSTETVGNNVDAFLNLFSPDGYGNPTTTTPTDPPTGDYRAQITGPGQFLHAQIPDGNGALAEGRQGAIQQLFYNNNFLHDWYYDAGFNEAAGNAQANNFGRGGLGNDSIRAQAQDFSGFNNANMLTGADGARPRMRMYVFPALSNKLEITNPPLGIANIGVWMVGKQTFDVTADIVVATFAQGPTICNVTNAAALDGKIALFDFDNTDNTGCSFSTRATRLSATAALAIVAVSPQATPTAVTNVTGFVPTITGSLSSISWNNGQVIKAALAAGPVTAHVFRAPDRDGTLDQQIVFHEFFHYVSNRLVGNGAGLGTNHAAGMGEGWSDFNAMLLTVRENDTQVPSNATFNGVYALATFATSGVPFNSTPNNSYYFGIRRYPYSTDMTRNPLTFKHITNGVVLPVGPPIGFGADGAQNAEVHNTGEVWSAMLWESYARLLQDTLGPTPRLTFQQAQDRMKKYVIAALKVTPVFPTFTEARDALLAVSLANDPFDYLAFRLAFAKRGAGPRAVAPDRFSANNAGVIEDFVTGPDLGFETAALDDSVSACDNDGVLDHGEIGKLTVTLRNTGTTLLSATTATVTTATPDVWYPSGSALSFPAMLPGATATASLDVAYVRTVSGIQQVDFQVVYTDAQLAAPLTKIIGFRTNSDEAAGASATETVEARTSKMTTAFNPALGNVAPWGRFEVDPLQHVWHADDGGATSDHQLITPALTVDATGTIGLQFDHSWSFEFAGASNFDGSVIEMSVDGGAFTDIGGPAYNGTLAAGGANPLAGRPAFVRTSAGTVHTSLTQQVPAGSIVKIRFRTGSDLDTGAPGWTIDNIAFTGVVETPFATVVPDTDSCTKVPASTDVAITVADGTDSVNVGGTVTYTIVATNLGSDDLVNGPTAAVSNVFSAGLTCNWTCAAGPGASCAAAGTGNILDHVSLPAGGSVTYTAICSVPLDTAVLSVASVASIAPPAPVTDPAPDNNASTDTDTVVRRAAHLTGSKIVTGHFVEGGTVTYAIALHNDSLGATFDNAGNELVDVLPAGLTLVSAVAAGGTATVSIDTNTVTWNGAIAADGVATITIVATINAAAGTTISNQATFSYDADGNGTNEATGTTDAVPCPPTP